MADFPSERYSLIAPAKINLTLKVLGKRPDGYHDLESVAVKVTLYDGIDLYDSADPAITIECSTPDVPIDGRNLIWKAAELLSAHRRQPPHLRLRLHKMIPMGAGLGGGSSDAGVVLSHLNQRWETRLSQEQLIDLAGQIGSDVALFLIPSAVLITGRGENVEAVRVPWGGWMLLVFPNFGISTAQVYQHWRQPKRSGQAHACLEPSCRHAQQLNRILFNDLEETIYTLAPRLKTLKEEIERRTGSLFHVTGSGSTLFSCADELEEVQRWQQPIESMSDVRTQIVRVMDNH